VGVSRRTRDHTCSPGERGDETGVEWPWARGMMRSVGMAEEQ
jgi:hypothetical protein